MEGREPSEHDLSSIRSLEELSLNAWPALRTIYDDGWVLRFADGYTRRANSVNPLYPSTEETREKIRHCERVYFSRGQDVVFKITPAVQPADLDSVLAAEGYARLALTSVQTVHLDTLDAPGSDAVSLDENLSRNWLEKFVDLSGVDGRHVQTMARMLEGIIPAHVFATLWQDSQAVAMGLAVLERGYVGLFDIVTAEHARNQGFGASLVCHLLRWSRSNGAHHAYLQVMCDNAPALHLYAKLGFREIYQYWYRVKRTAGPAFCPHGVGRPIPIPPR